MSKIRQIQTFVAVVENGSFSAAAKALGISSVGVSKHISQLEDKTQQSLFDRTTRLMVITDFGKQYYPECKKIISAIAEADLLVESHFSNLQGKLRLYSPPFIAGNFVLPLLSRFMRKYPLIKVELKVGDETPNLYEEDIDILIGYCPESLKSQENLRCCHLFESENVLAGSPEYFKEFGVPKTQKELLDHRFIQQLDLPQPLILSFVDGEKVEGLNTVLALGDRRIMCLAALQSMGIIHTAKRSIMPELVSGELIEVLPSTLIGTTRFDAFYKPSSIELPKVRKFLDLLTLIVNEMNIAKLPQASLNPYSKGK